MPAVKESVSLMSDDNKRPDRNTLLSYVYDSSMLEFVCYTHFVIIIIIIIIIK